MLVKLTFLFQMFKAELFLFPLILVGRLDVSWYSWKFANLRFANRKYDANYSTDMNYINFCFHVREGL